jgi:hypothetical protein
MWFVRFDRDPAVRHYYFPQTLSPSQNPAKHDGKRCLS